MKKHNLRNERGLVVVEATIILPIAILSVILLLYLSQFLFQKANLQACLETSLVYYKNTLTDTYVTKNSELEYTITENGTMASGNSYSATEPLNPYRGVFGDGHHMGDKEAFEAYFHSVSGKMLFDDDLKLTIDYSNYVILKQLKVTATQTVKAPIDFSILGVDNQYEISAAARVNVIDHDDMIRNVDYAIDIIEDTKLGELAKNFAAKFSNAYAKMKEVLKVQ